MNPMQGMPTRQPFPRCAVCGYIGQFRKGPLLQTHEIIIFLLLLLLFGVGLIYLVICLVTPKPMICPHCQSKDTAVYIY